MQIYDRAGRRKYLTPAERQNFLRAAQSAPPDVRTFCETLTHTGCRLSEGLNLTAVRVDGGAGVLVFECLKKRARGIYRAVPVPPQFLKTLADVHDLPALGEERLWPWSRTTGYRRICEIMEAAEVSGVHASPKGLRHGFGISATISEIPVTFTRKWMGHSRLETTSTYLDAMGPEEQRIAERMWS